MYDILCKIKVFCTNMPLFYILFLRCAKIYYINLLGNSCLKNKQNRRARVKHIPCVLPPTAQRSYLLQRSGPTSYSSAVLLRLPLKIAVFFCIFLVVCLSFFHRHSSCCPEIIHTAFVHFLTRIPIFCHSLFHTLVVV